jgi:cation:H+ antiporter
MGVFDFHRYPLWINLALFAAGGVAVWIAGIRLTRYVDAFAERVGLGRSFAGVLLLGGITSLPEIMTIGTASVIGNAPLAVNNVFGGVAMQVAVLVIADATVRGRPISSAIAGPDVLLQGVLLIFLLVVAAAGIVIGDVAVLSVGFWSGAVLLVAALGIFLVYRYESHERWEPVMLEDEERRGESGKPGAARRKRTRDLSTRRIALSIMAAGAVIVVAGFVVAKTGDALATQTGLGASLVGAVLVAVSTSLPEVSTTIAAARLGRFDMAFSNVFGANLLDVGLLFLADLLYAGAPVLNEVGRFALFGALLAIAVSAVYLAGLIVRPTRVVWRVGVDSLLVLAIYLTGLLGLYRLR